MMSPDTTQSRRRQSDASTETAQRQTSDTLPTAIAVRVAEQKGVSPERLPPLYEAINPDALAALFEPTIAGDRRAPGHVTFTYSGYRVTVTSRNEIDVEPTS